MMYKILLILKNLVNPVYPFVANCQQQFLRLP